MMSAWVYQLLVTHRWKVERTFTCMQRSELVIPPSTASSANLWPLSFSIAFKIALVWKQVASIVALAM